MEKVNIPPFYVGQTVYANETVESWLAPVKIIKDTSYTVYGLRFCCHWRVNIGHSIPDSYCCAACGSDLTGPVWYPSKYFSTKQEQKFPLMSFEKIVEKEKEEILINN